MPAANIVYVDSFSRYPTAGLDEAGWTVLNGSSGTMVCNAATGRFGGQSLRYAATSGTAGQNISYVTRSVSSQADFCIGFGFRTSTMPAAAFAIMGLLDSGTLHVDLRVNPAGTLSVTRNGTALTDGTSALALLPGVFYHIEFIVTIADSIGAGTCVVKVNGATWLTVATGQDTRNAANASANQVRLGCLAGTTTNGLTLDFSDLIIQNASGATFLGDRRVDFLPANANGNSSQFTGSDGNSVDNYLLVDDPTEDDDSTYVESSTVGHKDLYSLANLSSTPTVIDCIQTVLYHRMTDAGPRAICPVLRSGGADYDKATIGQASSYAYGTEIVLTDPATAAAWDAAGVNALEMGMKIIT